jgi:hypothetical protein
MALLAPWLHCHTIVTILGSSYCSVRPSLLVRDIINATILAAVRATMPYG